MGDDKQKFRVHGFQAYRFSYDVEAETAEIAAKMISDNPDGFSPSDIATTEDWLPESIVDPLLENGEVDYDNVKSIDIRSAMDLRHEALVLLQRAKALDGLQPYVVMHHHKYGVSSYIGWGGDALTEDEAISILDNEFESEKGETLVIDDGITLEDMTGISPSSQVRCSKSSIRRRCRMG